ncbi:MAG: hypothetical protein Q4G34_00740 [Micrococcus sp.]|nr:hypothetical protein [Micrococcus sp.]
MSHHDFPTSNISRRTVTHGLAWSVPAVAAVAAAPAYAASPQSCSTGTLNWANAPRTASTLDGSSAQRVQNGTMIPITLADGRLVYARATFPSDGVMTGQTGLWHRTVGRTAWGSAAGQYNFNTSVSTLVMNQQTSQRPTTVQLDFFLDPQARSPLTVFNVVVPLIDFSSATSWYRDLFTWRNLPERSYQEAWTVSAGTPSGATLTASTTALQNPYSNSNSTLQNIRGSGTATDPYYFPSSLTDRWNESVGGNLITNFGTAGVRSITVTYGSNNSSFTGAQGSGLGPITLCA